MQLMPLERVRRPLAHGVGDHVALRQGAGEAKATDAVFELNKSGVVQIVSYAAFQAGAPVASEGYIPEADLDAAYAHIQATLNQQLGYGFFRGWTCDTWVNWVACGSKRMSPQVKRGLGIASGVAASLAVAAGIAIRIRR